MDGILCMISVRPSFPRPPFQPAPNLAPDPALACLAFLFWFCFAFPLLPQSREMSSIKIDLKQEAPVAFASFPCSRRC